MPRAVPRRESRSALPKAAELLTALVERNGQVVSKEQLMSLLWQDTIVEEANLTQNIFLLRKV
ncbi:MAG TPA: winged helix-turn-helix domain-containing protein [Blastocatellia bacterium]|nr:winged helix-turn-helix domain-containing protein [Blastocatellia bacterium]